MFSLIFVLLSLTHAEGIYRPQICHPDEDWCKHPDMTTPYDLWVVTWRTWEKDHHATFRTMMFCMDGSDCNTPSRYFYHTELFVSQAGALDWLNRYYDGGVDNVVSVRRCSVVPLQRRVIGNKTVERTVTVKEVVPAEEWVTE
jgi:hypothetical protein